MKMNMSDYTTFDSMPSRTSRHPSALGNFASVHGSAELQWSPQPSSMLTMPNTPSLDVTVAPQCLSTNSTELLTPESLDTGYSVGGLAGDTSPLFDEFITGEMDTWESLFKDEDVKPVQPAAVPQPTFEFPPLEETSVLDMTGPAPIFKSEPSLFDLNTNFDFGVLDQVPITAPQHSETGAHAPASVASPRITGAMSPTVSSLTTSRGGVCKDASRNSKVDDLGITIYKRKPRAAPLKPVEIPVDGDEAGAKRAKNTEAARRSRARKLERMSQLEERIRLLMDENEALRAEVAALRERQL